MVQDDQGSNVARILTRQLSIRFIFVVVACIVAGVRAHSQGHATVSGLAIVDAGVESSEDGPVVAPDYEFLPGEFVYFSFQIAGFKAAGTEYNGPRQISLTYNIEIVDLKGIDLAKPEVGKIDEEIGREDKDWMPRRRAAFVLPSYSGSGKYKLKVKVDDTVAKTSAEREFQFNLGGRKIEPAQTLAVENFRFLREEQDGPGLEMPDYRPGDTVWARFDMCGFKTGLDRSVQLQYGLAVMRPEGKTLFQQQTAADEKITDLFYPPQFIPGVLSVSTTKDLSPGEYKMVIHLRDLVGKQTAEFERSFRIE